MKVLEKHEKLFYDGVKHAKDYKEQHNNLTVEENYVCDDGFRLGRWLANKRANLRIGAIPEYQLPFLQELDIAGNLRTDAWNANYCDMYYLISHGVKACEAKKYRSHTGANLSVWYAHARRQYNVGAYNSDRMHKMDILIDAVRDNVHKTKVEKAEDVLLDYDVLITGNCA